VSEIDGEIDVSEIDVSEINGEIDDLRGGKEA
jgi:hypothetical protein